MSRYFQRPGTNQQRLLLENLRQDEDVYYLNNGGSLEVKRPNIISRRNNNNKFQVFQVQSTATAPVLSTFNNTISYMETYNPDEVTIVSDSVPIELLSSDNFMVSEAPFSEAIVTELSLALEPTVVSQPIPTEIPLTYDSTCVSQAISTPIVTPIVSSSGLVSDYVTTNTPNTFHVFCQGEDVQISDVNELGIPIQVLGQLEPDSVFLNADVPVSSTAEGEFELGSEAELEQVIAADELPPHSAQNQMRIETQPDGSLVLYLEGPSSSAVDAVDIVSDAEIIQTDSFPVVPNVPVELPSQRNDGQTESFILVQIDDQGNTVLVPTSSLIKTRRTPRRQLRQASMSSYPGYNGAIPRGTLEVEGEKPKPFRYDLPEEPSESSFLDDNNIMTSLNLSSSLVPHFYPKQTGWDAEENQDLNISMSEEQPNTTNGETQVLNEIEAISVCKGTDSPDDAETIERTPLGIFRCKFCSRETRLKVLMLNHIKRSHKKQEIVLSPRPEGCDTEHETIKIHPENVVQTVNGDIFVEIESDDKCEENNFTLVSASHTSCIASTDDPGFSDAAPENTILNTSLMTSTDGHHQRIQNQTKSKAKYYNQDKNSSEFRNEMSEDSIKSKRQRILKVAEWNPKLEKISVEPVLLKSEPPLALTTARISNPKKYPSKKATLAPADTLMSTARMRTRSHSGGGERCLRNCRYKGS